MSRLNKTCGSVIDRSWVRQRGVNGMATWHFDLVMEHLLMLQAAPPLLVMFSLTTPNSLIGLFLALSSVSLHSVSLIPHHPHHYYPYNLSRRVGTLTYMTAVGIIEGQERSGEYHESTAIFSSPPRPEAFNLE